MTRVLIIDDDQMVRRLLRRCMEDEGFSVVEAADGGAALDEIHTNRFDLVTLDLALGADNGFEIAKAIRRESATPIIMVSGKSDLIDQVVGLEIGADDFITKPFHVREVAARVRAVLRRANAAGGRQVAPGESGPASEPAAARGHCLCFEGFEARLDQFELIDPEGQLVELTSGDFRLLRVFLENPGRALSRERIMDLLNGPGWSPLDRTIDNQVARLRKKIEPEPSAPRFIKTVRGIGYMLTAAVATC